MLMNIAQLGDHTGVSSERIYFIKEVKDSLGECTAFLCKLLTAYICINQFEKMASVIYNTKVL